MGADRLIGVILSEAGRARVKCEGVSCACGGEREELCRASASRADA